MITGRDYQFAARDFTIKKITEKHCNPLILMPTGTGKSVVIAMLLQYMFQWPSQRVLMLTHVKELIEQNYKKLLEVWPQAPVGIYSAGLKQRDLYNPILFCGIQSVAKKAHLFGKVDVIFVDEAHLISPTEKTNYRKFINQLRVTNPLLLVIGLSATGFRSGQGMLTEGDDALFDEIAFDACSMESFNWFIDEGYLSMLLPKPMKLQFDLSGVQTQAGDYNQAQLQLAVDKIEITRAAIKETMEVGIDRNSWLIFASGVDHAKHIAEMLNAQGVSCACVYTGMEANRDEQINGFKSGKYRAIVNFGVLTTGFDHPGIDLIVILRPTKSVVLWVQMLGRGTRPVYWTGGHPYDLGTKEGRLAAIADGPKKNCLVLDFARNSKKLGPINDPLVPKPKGKGPPGEAPIKECPVCNFYNHTRAMVCVNCGHTFTQTVKLDQQASTVPLVKTFVPEVVEFDVDTIFYSQHTNKNGGNSVKITYDCGIRRFYDWVNFEIGGSVHGMAKHWWFEHSSTACPTSTADALNVINKIAVPTQLRIWVNNKPYPKILARCFDGTSFGKKEKDLRPVAINVQKPAVFEPYHKPEPLRNRIAGYDDLDDDIPF